MAVPVESFFLDPDGEGTLQVRIQQMIAQGVLSGRFEPGEKLPSTRKLAKHLGISRITVTLAYTELQAMDYLESKGRSGFFISESAPKPPEFAPETTREETVDWSRALGQRFVNHAEALKPLDWERYKYPFIYGQADPTLFDHSNWRLCALRALGGRDFNAMTSDYYDKDDPQLVSFIARHTLPRRGIHARPEEILVTLGAQNALWLAAQVLLTQRRKAAIEEPCYPALRDVLTQSRCHLAHVQVDEQGLPPEALPDDTDVIFATPSHHSPTSATMQLDRRRALLRRAKEMDALIVEDDYEFEMSYIESPHPALKSLDAEGRVIYVGSFSKSLFPGLRLGYLVGSEPFIREARALRASVLRHPPGHVQRTVAHFLSLGHYDALMRRLARALHQRREVVLDGIKQHGLTIAGQNKFGGSAFWMRAPDGVDTHVLAERLREKSVLIEPGHSFFAGPERPVEYYRLGYSSIAASRIPDGLRVLTDTIKELSSSAAISANGSAL